MNTVNQIENTLKKASFFFRLAGFNGLDFYFEAERHNNIYYVAKSHEDEEYSLEEVRNNLENNKWIIC